MKTILTAAIAAMTLAGAVSATATAADARPYGGHGYYGGGRYYGHGNNGAAIVAGVAGLAIGAALASDHPHYARGYYGGPYYGDAYYGPAYYGTCYTTRWAWDPYMGRRVPVRQAYAC